MIWNNFNDFQIVLNVDRCCSKTILNLSSFIGLYNIKSAGNMKYIYWLSNVIDYCWPMFLRDHFWMSVILLVVCVSPFLSVSYWSVLTSPSGDYLMQKNTTTAISETWHWKLVPVAVFYWNMIWIRIRNVNNFLLPSWCSQRLVSLTLFKLKYIHVLWTLHALLGILFFLNWRR